MVEFLSDRKILLGVGIGIIFGVIAMSGVKYNSSISDAKIEERARKMGMKFPSEINVINNKDVK